MNRFSNVAILGVGLIGGSIGLAVRKHKLARQVVGIGRSATRLAAARRRGAVDRTTTSVAKGVADAELVVVCTPVGLIPAHVEDVAAACPADAIITDAGSTKAQVVAEVDARLASLSKNRPAPTFLGSHPLAGDHRTGVEHARDDLLCGRTVVVTPSRPAAQRDAIARLEAFWTALGANVRRMTPEAHDRALAAASHSPHLVAAALAIATPSSALPLTAGGWRDTTRIAGSDPRLWRDIIATNRDHVIDSLRRVESEIANLRAAIEDGNLQRLEKLLAKAKRIRDAF